MVARRQVVGDAVVVEDVHREIGSLPLDFDRVEVLRDVTELAHEDDVEVVRVIDDPLGLLVEGARSVCDIDVVLGVRDDDDSEVFGSRGAGHSAIERRRQLTAVESMTPTCSVGLTETPVAPSVGAMFVGTFGGLFAVETKGVPATHNGPLVRVPSIVVPAELAIVVRAPRSCPAGNKARGGGHRAGHRSWICGSVRALFQMRA